MTYLQARYPDDFSHCHGCGRLNADGLHVQSEWRGDHAVARHVPAPSHMAVPGFVYGGLLASLVDCHGIATAAASWMAARGEDPHVAPMARFVTARLDVQYLAPTPMGPALELVARATEVGTRKAVVEVTVRAEGVECVRGTVVGVVIPERMMRPPDAA